MFAGDTSPYASALLDIYSSTWTEHLGRPPMALVDTSQTAGALQLSSKAPICTS